MKSVVTLQPQMRPLSASLSGDDSRYQAQDCTSRHLPLDPTLHPLVLSVLLN